MNTNHPRLNVTTHYFPTRRSSCLRIVAAHPKFIPLDVPIFLSMDRAEPTGICIAQDTGGAINGPNRVDTFLGAGAEARAIAGGMSARWSAWLLVPKGPYARLMQANGTPSSQP